ncbi:hypothetical protein ACWIDS_16365 [Dietzia maris]
MSITDLCQCGHAREAHIYYEGPCRPGFVCRDRCDEFRLVVGPDTEKAPEPQLRVEPPADLRQAATVTRQMYVAYVDAGFEPAQALMLTVAMTSQRRGGSR